MKTITWRPEAAFLDEASCNATQSDVIKRRNRIINDDAVFHRLSANIRKKAS